MLRSDVPLKNKEHEPDRCSTNDVHVSWSWRWRQLYILNSIGIVGGIVHSSFNNTFAPLNLIAKELESLPVAEQSHSYPLPYKTETAFSDNYHKSPCSWRHQNPSHQSGQAATSGDNRPHSHNTQPAYKVKTEFPSCTSISPNTWL